MTEDKLIDKLERKSRLWNGTMWVICVPSFRCAIREALAAQRRGCAETWLKMTFDDALEERRKVSTGYLRILNAEPEDV